MIEILPKSTESCIGFKFSGEITTDERYFDMDQLEEAWQWVLEA